MKRLISLARSLFSIRWKMLQVLNEVVILRGSLERWCSSEIIPIL